MVLRAGLVPGTRGRARQGSFASSPHWIQKASASSTGVVPPSGMFFARGEGPLSVFLLQQQYFPSLPQSSSSPFARYSYF